MKVLDGLIKNSCTMYLSDTRLVQGTWIQLVHWFGNTFFPLMAENGVEKAALVYKAGTFAQQAMQRTVELNHSIEIQTFLELRTAEQWLFGQLEPSVLNAGYLQGKILIEGKGKYSIIKHEDILYVYSFEKGTAIQSRVSLDFTRKSLKEVFSQLPEQFFQVHRSYIVNLSCVQSVRYHNSGSYHIFLQDMPGIKIPVSKKYVPELRRLLKLEK